MKTDWQTLPAIRSGERWKSQQRAHKVNLANLINDIYMVKLKSLYHWAPSTILVVVIGLTRNSSLQSLGQWGPI